MSIIEILILVYVVTVVVTISLHVYVAKKYSYTWVDFVNGWPLFFIPIVNTAVFVLVVVIEIWERFVQPIVDKIANKWDKVKHNKVFGDNK